jgi:hypothetical protein
VWAEPGLGASFSQAQIKLVHWFRGGPAPAKKATTSEGKGGRAEGLLCRRGRHPESGCCTLSVRRAPRCPLCSVAPPPAFSWPQSFWDSAANPQIGSSVGGILSLEGDGGVPTTSESTPQLSRVTVLGLFWCWEAVFLRMWWFSQVPVFGDFWSGGWAEPLSLEGDACRWTPPGVTRCPLCAAAPPPALP